MSENKFLEAKSPLFKRQITVEVQAREKLGGGLERKDRLFAIIRSGLRKRELRLIERFGLEDESQHLEAKRLESLWRVFRAAGLPVLPTLRVTEKNSVLVTDMKTETNEIYGKGISMFNEGREKRSATGLSPADISFLQKYASLRPQIVAESQKIAELATSHHLLLPRDDPATLVYDALGKWSIVLLDLGDGVIVENFEKEHIKGEEDLRSLNQRSMSVFIEFLDTVSERLMTPEVISLQFDTWRQEAAKIFKSDAFVATEEDGFSIYSNMNRVIAAVMAAYEVLYPGEKADKDDIREALEEAQTKTKSVQAAPYFRVAGSIKKGLEFFFRVPASHLPEKVYPFQQLSLRMFFVQSNDGGIIYGGMSPHGELSSVIRQGWLKRAEQKASRN